MRVVVSSDNLVASYSYTAVDLGAGGLAAMDALPTASASSPDDVYVRGDGIYEKRIFTGIDATISLSNGNIFDYTHANNVTFLNNFRWFFWCFYYCYLNGNYQKQRWVEFTQCVLFSKFIDCYVRW